MKRGVLIVLLMGALVLGAGMPVWAADDDGSQVRILSPENGAVVKGNAVEVQYILVKGKQATHVHIYLDGKYQKGFSGSLKGVTPGKHEIRAVAANPDHKLFAAESVVMITVQ